MWETKGRLVHSLHLQTYIVSPLTTWSRAKAERMTRWATLRSAHTSKVCIANKHSDSMEWMKWMLDWVSWTAAIRWIGTQVLHTSHTRWWGGSEHQVGGFVTRQPPPLPAHAMLLAHHRVAAFEEVFLVFVKNKNCYRTVWRATI